MVNPSHVVLTVKYWYDILYYQLPFTLLHSIVISHKINSTDINTCCRAPNDFKVFNRHGDELHLSYLNDEINKMSTPLPNLEHGLGINKNDIKYYMSLSNVLYLEEEQLSTPLNKDVNV